ncbi:hypothetical protein DVA86_34070 [Streptomyces armeniacus]|uniref:Chaplin n=1 Tax=Streptomyces armeniacus TaxID=83291 RepID=A0A345XYV9_9ACTN|nr:hypothetical protein [Streptomyces armeniacus]AXK36825.1 hypothetical protein DVA86_34070 [Streptomyces armeniacus]
MARIRTARVIAAVAALPLAFAVLGGVAQADDGRNSTVNSQVAVGAGASNEANNASLNNSPFSVVDQSDTVITFTDLW